MKIKLPYIILIFFVCSLSKSLAQNSVLSKGNWVKIGVINSGVYKLDASFLQKVGFDIAQINPRNIKIYGNGGGMLPQSNMITRPKDLIENAISVEGETDEKFDNQDFILFYGQSPHAINYDSLSKSFSHQFNIYSDTTFYFLTVSDTKGLRIKDQDSVSATQEIIAFDDFVFHEIDRKNILAQAPFAGSGREWVGEEFTGNVEQVFPFNQTGIIPNSPLKIKASIAAAAFGQTEFMIKANGLSVGNITLNAIGEDRYDYKGAFSSKSFTINPDFTNTSDLKIGLTYNRKSLSSGVGYLNFLGIQTVRNLKLYGNQTIFRSIESLQYQTVKFSLNETNINFKIWDISNPAQAQNQLYTLQNQKLSFGVSTSTLKDFIVFNNTNFLDPVSFSKINNQNLQPLETPDLLIVTSESLRKQANRLADFRRQNDKLSVEVVSTQEIYNEFASGKQDISAIRDFVKSLYERNSLKLKYLLLFGDASFDYKKRLNVISDQTKEVLIPTYESRESLHPIYSFSSDDYFGFLSNNEGTWEENSSGNHTLEIGIGRLPVKSIQEAEDMVDKLIYYSSNKTTIGNWRSKLAFIADNGDGNIHQEDANTFAQIIERQYFDYQPEKIYVDAFPLISSASVQSSPEAKKATLQAFQEGVLIMNYNGHGSEVGLTDEQILTIGDIVNLKNYNTLPLMLTATCQFGRFDDPNQVSGAELSILNPNGGAIALLTTTRPVFQNTNYVINQAFYQSIFKPINGKMPRLGDVMVYTKNNSLQGVINRNFTLLGDPSMRLNYPENEAVITKINGKNTTKGDTLKALTKVVLDGEIVERDTKTKVSSFNGIAQITIYDKQKSIQTLGSQGSKFVYQDYQNILFNGQVKVQNGSFSCSFVVPKDINYQYGEGKIFVYAQTTDATSDASGSSKPIVGGASNQNLLDNQPPQIRLFLNDENFIDGGTTNNSPVLIAKIADENGINIATDGLGHELLLTLDDTVKVIVNQYFINSLDDFSSGVIRYNFKNLSEGKHKLKLKVWDNYNNSSESTLKFEVNSAENDLLKNVFCYPNPFTQTTNFSFEHERVGEDFNIIIEIYDSYGRLIKQINKNVYQISSPFDKISWNLAEDSVPIVTGNYFYRIFAKSLITNYQASGSGKIVSVK
ncbi:type IX secretion system sortase PorU [Arcicella sp. LKC2W]|uniref:type IX secretion system sortase PorU n=1 Tax=Arcicella sp. LKC2W TaxID=2984198 RepID=UPI002B2053FC|nr:type IX secretion system sortase PorU [Arcicella sp. LKC2W]MEA5458314.1 type IX secretion system sortase PorU [Arcicella sp. LKC2W]